MIGVGLRTDRFTAAHPQGDWGPDDKCQQTGRQADTIPMPYNFTTAYDGRPAGQIGNNGLGMRLKCGSEKN